MLFSLIGFELSIVLINCELNCSIMSAANSVYVMCICLIYYGLSCDVDLSRPFMMLGGLPDLCKWKCMRVNVISEDNRTWACI